MKKKSYKIIILILFLIALGEGIFIWNILQPRRQKKQEPPEEEITHKAMIAIVIDDWGYNLNNIDFIRDTEEPFCVSILPNLPYSKTISEIAFKAGKEIIIHLPLEPYISEGAEGEEIKLEENTILTTMSEKEVRTILRAAFEDIAYARGVSNHMGSKATEDEGLMEIIFQELKRKNLYFLDSLVSPNSVCFDLASKMGVKFAKRNVFLDYKENPEYIIGQISKLANKAKVFGYAIGIGHNKYSTLAVLKKYLPKLVESGYKLVTVSELIEYVDSGD